MNSARDIHLGPDGKPRIIERRFVVAEEYAGFRLDHYLKKQIPRLSRNRLQTIIKSNLLHTGGKNLKPNTRVAAGDELILRREAQPEPPCPRTFDVLYDDATCMVLNKPAGLPVHASAKFYFNTLTRVLSERYPGQGLQIAHRLDRETSGCLAVARGKQAAAALKTAFSDKKAVRKEYLAIVQGIPASDDAVIDAPLRLVDPGQALIDIRMAVHPEGVRAITKVRVVERRARCALVRCQLITGRQHQIRAHLSYAGHPIVGDKLYAHGDEAFAAYCEHGLTDELLARFELPRHALHAALIAFPHPASGAPVEVEAPLPPDLRDYLAQN